MNARHSTLHLYLIAKINPQAWDAIIPHGPKVSPAAREYLIAMALKGFSAELSNRAVSARLAGIQKRLVESAGSRLAADYGDDDWCPRPWHIKIPIPVPGPRRPDPAPWFSSFAEVMLNPQPLPPKAAQKEIAGYLLLLSEATANQEAAKELQAIGNSLMR